jgi:hypothetical protein
MNPQTPKRTVKVLRADFPSGPEGRQAYKTAWLRAYRKAHEFNNSRCDCGRPATRRWTDTTGVCERCYALDSGNHSTERYGSRSQRPDVGGVQVCSVIGTAELRRAYDI